MMTDVVKTCLRAVENATSLAGGDLDAALAALSDMTINMGFTSREYDRFKKAFLANRARLPEAIVAAAESVLETFESVRAQL